MADEAARRREARRRRIIENSDDRMKKLLGLQKDDETAVTTSELDEGTETKDEKPNESAEGEQDDTKSESEQKPTDTGDESKQEATVEVPDTDDHTEENVSENELHQGKIKEIDCDIGISEKSDNSQPETVRFKEELESPESLEGRAQRSRSSSPLRTDDELDNQLNVKQKAEHEQLQKFANARQLLCLVIGALVRMMFVYFSLYQNIFVPFLAFEMAVTIYQRQNAMELGAEVKGGLWLSTMVLSGIKPEVIETYKNVMGAVSAAMDDFTVYFFAFVITHIIAPVAA